MPLCTFIIESISMLDIYADSVFHLKCMHGPFRRCKNAPNSAYNNAFCLERPTFRCSKSLIPLVIANIDYKYDYHIVFLFMHVNLKFVELIEFNSRGFYRSKGFEIFPIGLARKQCGMWSIKVYFLCYSRINLFAFTLLCTCI